MAIKRRSSTGGISPEAAPTPPAAETPKEPAPSSAPEAAPEKSFLRRAYERFVSKFRGEAQPEDNKDYKTTGTDFSKALAMGALSVVATYTGVKVFADLPPWFYQKFWTNRAERKRIMNALAAKETKLGETTEPSAIDQKKARLEEAINASKFLTKEKKAKLLGQLHKIVDEYEEKDKSLRNKRNEKIAELLNEAIQSRVKNTQVLKEGLNSALMLTGLSAMRGVAYGSVALYERYKKVSGEREEKTRKGEKIKEGFMKEWIWRGFTQTLHDLKGGKADTWTGKGMNFVKGASIVFRAVGFADLATAEILGEGFGMAADPKEQLKKFANDFREKGAKAMIDNALAPWERLAGLARGDMRPFGLSNTAPSVEIPESQFEAGLVKKEDVLVRKILTLDEAREAGFTYESGTVPGEIPTQKKIAEHVFEPKLPEPTPQTGGLSDSPAPNESTIQNVETVAHPASVQGPLQEATEVKDTEPLRRFHSESGKIRFVYNKDGTVKDAWMPAYTPGRRDIEDSLREWGLTTKEVKAHFFKGTSLTHTDRTMIDTSHPERYPEVNPTESRAGFPIQSPENDYRQFVRNAERLTRQEALLNDMAEHGYTRTPEFARLKMETETLESYVAGNMKKQFHIKERPL